MTKRSLPWRLMNSKGEFASTHWEGRPAVICFHTKVGAQALADLEKKRFAGYKPVNVDSLWYRVKLIAKGLTKPKI